MINVVGNVIAREWYKTITLANGKPDLVAISLLSEIVYWYRPSTNGSKKFKADILQKSYSELSDIFGFTKYQVKEALERLEKLKVISRQFRVVRSINCVLNNVLFIGLDTKVLADLSTLPQSTTGGCTSQLQDPPPVEEGTYTENTTETTTENLATPLRSDDLENARENMKALGNTSILDSLKSNMPKKKIGKVTISSLSLKWKEIRAEATEGYSPELTGKELGFLKLILKDFESRSLEALNYIAENWAVFAEKACQSAGIENRPTKPNLGFLAQNRAVLWELLQGSNTQEQKTEVVSTEMATVVPEIGESDDALFDALK